MRGPRRPEVNFIPKKLVLWFINDVANNSLSFGGRKLVFLSKLHHDNNNDTSNNYDSFAKNAKSHNLAAAQHSMLSQGNCNSLGHLSYAVRPPVWFMTRIITFQIAIKNYDSLA